MMKHPDLYLHDTNGAIIPPEPAWTDVTGVNYANPDLRRYMTDMMKYWLQDYGVDGFPNEVVLLSGPIIRSHLAQSGRT